MLYQMILNLVLLDLNPQANSNANMSQGQQIPYMGGIDNVNNLSNVANMAQDAVRTQTGVQSGVGA